MSQSHATGIARGLHAALIMDGNGRWATARGLPRLAGHRAGADTVRRVAENAPRLGIGTLTLYAFSSDNWKRPPAEVRGLMRLLAEYLRRETPTCLKNDVRLRAIGRRDRFPRPLIEALDESERATAHGKTLELRLALDYSSHDVLARAARQMAEAAARTGSAQPAISGGDPAGGVDEAAARDALARAIASAMHTDAVVPVDLLIRTGGEQRLSDFLLWEAAYAELFFTRTMWPAFEIRELETIVEAFKGRERRFGRLPDRAAS